MTGKGTRKTIVFATGDSNLAETLSDLLDAEGYCTTAAVNAEKATDLVLELMPAVVLIDLELPDTPGVELVKRIRELSEDAKCIVVAGDGGDDSAFEAINQGACGCVRKRSCREQLMPVLRRAVHERRVMLTLRDFESRFQQAVNRSPNPIFAVDAEHRIQFWNRSCERFLQYGQDILGQHYDVLLAEPDNLPFFSQTVARVFQDHSLSDVEIRFRCRDGSIIIASSRLYPLRDLKGRIDRCVFANTDITGRRRAQEELKKSEKKHRLLVERSPFGVVVTDRSGNIVEVNPAACKLAGLPREELIGVSALDFMTTPESRETALQFLEELSLDSRMDETVFVGPDARLFRVNTTVFQKDPFLMYSTVEEITEKQRMEQQLRQSQKMEAIGTLAGGVAHDMNNVLAAIMGLACALEAEMQPGDHKLDDVLEILEACKRGRDLTRNLLGFARRGKHATETFGLNQTVKEVETILRHTLPKKVIIDTRLDEQLFSINGDPNQLNHALMNLCINATEAVSGEGRLSITTENIRDGDSDSAAHREGKFGKRVRLRVSDTGMGMDSHTLEKCFEPFFTTKPKGQGTGLGLSMVYGTVVNHGGTVSVQSEPGRGTTVTIELPANDAAAASERPRRKQALSLSGTGTIMLVDDEAAIRSAGKKLLSKLGYTVLLAEDGERALETYRQNKDEISLVMLDLIMPRMDGVEALTKLRQINPEVRVLLMSGFPGGEAAQEVSAMGASGFLQKPFELQDLAEQVARALDDKGRQPRRTAVKRGELDQHSIH